MFYTILVYTVVVIEAIPKLLWLAFCALCKGGWKLLCFICQRQYRELIRRCEHGSADELQAYLETHQGARKYVIYLQEGKSTSAILSFFQLPSPLAVAVNANNLEVIPVLLANGASPTIRNLSDERTPAEEAIGDPEKMRALCGGKTWWLDTSDTNKKMLDHAIDTHNARGIIWNVLRGARLTSHEQLYARSFLRLPRVMKKFVCQFGIKQEQQGEFYELLIQLTQRQVDNIIKYEIRTPFGYRGVLPPLQKGFAEMMECLKNALEPYPAVDNGEISNLLFSSVLMSRSQMQELLNSLFDQERQFALLRHFLDTPVSPENREMTEEIVDCLLCSLLEKAKS